MAQEVAFDEVDEWAEENATCKDCVYFEETYRGGYCKLFRENVDPDWEACNFFKHFAEGGEE